MVRADKFGLKKIERFLKRASFPYWPGYYDGRDITTTFLDGLAQKYGAKTDKLSWIDEDFALNLKISIEMPQRFLYMGQRAVPVDASFDIDIQSDFLSRHYPTQIRNFKITIGNDATIDELIRHPDTKPIKMLYENSHLVKKFFQNGYMEIGVITFKKTDYTDPNKIIKDYHDAITLYQLGVPQEDGKSMIEQIIDDITSGLVAERYVRNPSDIEVSSITLIDRDSTEKLYLRADFEGIVENQNGKNLIALPNDVFFLPNEALTVKVSVSRPSLEPLYKLPDYQIEFPSGGLSGRFYPSLRAFEEEQGKD